MFDAEEWIEKLHVSKRGRRILLRCLELYDLDQIVAVLTDEYANGRGRIFNTDRLISKAKDLFAFLTRIDIDAGNRIRFTQHLDEYVSCRNMVDSLYLEIIRYAEQDTQFKRNLQLLVTIPGIDVRTALSILVEIADINYFEQSKSLVKWTGLTPSVSQSGYKKRQSGRIHKGGNKWLRKTIWYAASLDYAHLKEDEEGHPVGAFIRRLIKSGKKLYKVAVTAGARKLTTYIFHILTQQIPFEEMFELHHSERHEKNKERKLFSLKRMLKRSTAVEILPILADELSQKIIELNHTETLIAKEIGNLLGVGSVSSIDLPWS